MAFKKVTYNLGEDAQLNLVEPIRSLDSINDMCKFFDKNGWHKYTVILSLGCYCGLRISDLLSLKIEHLQKGLQEQHILLREQKTGKINCFRLNPRLYGLITDWIKDKDSSEWAFEGRPHKKLDRSQVYRRLNQAAQAVNLKSNIGTHTLRKTFGYWVYNQFPNSLPLLQMMFNHTSQEVTKRYIGITQDDLDDIYINLDLTAHQETKKQQLERIIKEAKYQPLKRNLVSFCNIGLKMKDSEIYVFVKLLIKLIENCTHTKAFYTKQAGN